MKGGGSQPISALHAIIGLMVFATAALLAISFWMTFRFKLTQKNHNILIKEIARRKLGGGADDCDDETRAVIKALTGRAWNEVWDASSEDNKKSAALVPGS